jgi:hypothetical protein
MRLSAGRSNRRSLYQDERLELKLVAKNRLNLRAGEVVEVRSQEEILSKLDAEGRLDGLPFMPEMLKYSGRRFRVYKSAHKTCDTIGKTGNRRMMNAVHLEGLRCDGESHGGCQAACLLFWKEAWLKRPSAPDPRESMSTVHARQRCTRETLLNATQIGRSGEDNSAEAVFSCQATELTRATLPLHWWDFRQYVKDLISGNVSLSRFLRVTALALFNMIQRRRRGSQFPRFEPRAPANKTPRVTLGIEPGELVEVRSKEEIEQTVGADSRNRGLWFDVEMLQYCNRRFRVLQRVERIIDDKSGKMLRFASDCLILDGVSCSGDFSYKRRFCPRAIYPFWREIWLKRVD